MDAKIKFTSTQTKFLLTTAYNYDPKRGSVYDREILGTKWIQHWLHLIGIKQGLKKLVRKDECLPLEVTPCAYPPPGFEGSHDKEVKKEEERKRLIREREDKQKLEQEALNRLSLASVQPRGQIETSKNSDGDYGVYTFESLTEAPSGSEEEKIEAFPESFNLDSIPISLDSTKSISPISPIDKASNDSSQQKKEPNALDHLEYLLKGFGKFRFDFVYVKNKNNLFDSHVFQACYLLSSSPSFQIESSKTSKETEQKTKAADFFSGLLSPQETRFCDTFVAVVASVAPTDSISKDVTDAELIGWLHWIHDVDAQTELQVQTEEPTEDKDKPVEDKSVENPSQNLTFENSFRRLASEFSNLESIEESFQKEKEMQNKIQTPDFYGRIENERQKQKEKDQKRELFTKARISKRNNLLESFLAKAIKHNASLVRTITKAKLANTFVHSRICPHFSLFYNLFVCSSSSSSSSSSGKIEEETKNKKEGVGEVGSSLFSSSSSPLRVFYFSEYVPHSLAGWLSEKEDQIQVSEVISILFLFTFSIYTLLLAGYEFSWLADEYVRGRFKKKVISLAMMKEIEAWILENWRYHSIEKGGGWHYVLPVPPPSIDFPTGFSVRENVKAKNPKHTNGRQKGTGTLLRSSQKEKEKKPWQMFRPLSQAEIKESASLVTSRLVPNLGAMWVFANLDPFQNQIQNYKEEKKFKSVELKLGQIAAAEDLEFSQQQASQEKEAKQTPEQEKRFRDGYQTDSSMEDEEEQEESLQFGGNFHEIEVPVKEVGEDFSSSQVRVTLKRQPGKVFQHFMLVLSLISIFKQKIKFFLSRAEQQIKKFEQQGGEELEIELEKKRENEQSWAFLEFCEFTLQQEDILETPTSDLLTKITARLAPTSSVSGAHHDSPFSSRLTVTSKLVTNLCGRVESYWKFLLSDVFQELNPEKQREEQSDWNKKKKKKNGLFRKAKQKEKESSLNVLRPVFTSIQEMFAFDGMKTEKKKICEKWGKEFCSSLTAAPVSQDTDWYRHEMEFNLSKQYFQYNPLAIYQWSQANPLFLDLLTPFFGYWSAKQKIFNRLLGSSSWNDSHQFDDEEFLLERGANQEEHFPSVLLLQQLEEEEYDVQIRLTKQADRIVPSSFSSPAGLSIAKDQERTKRVQFFLKNIRSPYFGMFVDAIAKAQQIRESDTRNAWDVIERAGHALFALVPQLENRGRQDLDMASSDLATGSETLGEQLSAQVEGKRKSALEKKELLEKREQKRKKEISVWESNAWMPLIPFSGSLHSPKDRFLLNSSFTELSDYFATLEAEVLSQNFTLSSQKLISDDRPGALPLKQKYKQVLLIFDKYPDMWERVKKRLSLQHFLEFNIDQIAQEIEAEKKTYLDEMEIEDSDRNIELERKIESTMLNWLSKGSQSLQSPSGKFVGVSGGQGILAPDTFAERISEASLPPELVISETQIQELNELKKKLTTTKEVTIEEQVETFIQFINIVPPFVISLIVRKIHQLSKKQKEKNQQATSEPEDFNVDDEFWALQRFKEIFELQTALEHFALQTLKEEVIHKSRLDFF